MRLESALCLPLSPARLLSLSLLTAVLSHSPDWKAPSGPLSSAFQGQSLAFSLTVGFCHPASLSTLPLCFHIAVPAQCLLSLAFTLCLAKTVPSAQSVLYPCASRPVLVNSYSSPKPQVPSSPASCAKDPCLPMSSLP